MVGTKHEFNERDFTQQFEGEFTTKVKSIILQYMMQNNLSFKQISAYLSQMSDYLKECMAPFCNELGLNLAKFYINTIEVDDSTPEGVRIKEAIAKQAEMSITGRTWQQEQMFGTANNAIDGFSNAMGNASGAGGILGGILAINMMNGMGGGMGAGMGGGMAQSMMQPQYNQPAFSGNNNMQGGAPTEQGLQPTKMVYCSNCSNKYPNSMRFCPKCGDPYNPCPKCGTDNDQNARRCIGCGLQLQGGNAVCPNCNGPLPAGASFCGNCGTRIGSTDVCSRCGNTLSPTVKFCPICGNKR